MTQDPLDAEIAEFHRAARKRKAWIFAIAGIFSILAGVAALIVSFSVEDPMTGSRRFEVKVIALGIALVVGGLGSAWNAYRIGSGQVADVD